MLFFYSSSLLSSPTLRSRSDVTRSDWLRRPRPRLPPPVSMETAEGSAAGLVPLFPPLLSPAPSLRSAGPLRWTGPALHAWAARPRSSSGRRWVSPSTKWLISGSRRGLTRGPAEVGGGGGGGGGGVSLPSLIPGLGGSAFGGAFVFVRAVRVPATQPLFK